MWCFIRQYTCTLLQNEDFIRIVFVECVNRLLLRQGAGVVLTHKWEQCKNCWGGCQKKFPVELKMRSEHRSLGFYQVQISKNPGLLTVIPRTSGKVLKCNYTVRESKKHRIQMYLNLFKHFSFYSLFHLVHGKVHSEANTCIS